MLSNKAYDILQWLSYVVFPALATLVLTLGDIWGFPYAVQIGATISAVALFLGAILKVSNIKYNASLKEENK